MLNHPFKKRKEKPSRISFTLFQTKEKPDGSHHLLCAEVCGCPSSPGSLPGPDGFWEVQFHQFSPVSVQWESHQPGNGGLLLHRLHQEGTRVAPRCI